MIMRRNPIELADAAARNDVRGSRLARGERAKIPSKTRFELSSTFYWLKQKYEIQCSVIGHLASPKREFVNEGHNPIRELKDGEIFLFFSL
jgi:hypothetical protein